MKKKNFVFPLSYKDIAKILGKNDETQAEISGIVMVNKFNTPAETLESIKEQIFKTVYDQWSDEQSVVVGKNKLLCEVDVVDFSITEQAPSIKNLIVMSIKANVMIKQDPSYAQEIIDAEKEVIAKQKDRYKTLGF